MAEMRPILVVISYNIIYTGMFLITKAAFDVGMNISIFVFYRQAIATILLFPIAIYLERKSAPPFCFKVTIKIFFLSFVGLTGTLNIYGMGVKYTSASLAAAVSTTLPVITFFLALIFGMEKVNIRANSSIWKLTGVAFCMAGVLTIAFYKGPSWIISHYDVFRNKEPQINNNEATHHSSSRSKTWIIGVFLVLLSNVTWSLWIVLQGPILKDYSSKLLFTSYACLFSTIQSFIVAIIVERDPSKWKLGWNLQLLAVIYCAIVVTVIGLYLQVWVIEKKGPVFFAMSSPLAWIFTLVSSTFLLAETLSLGSVLGAILLITALYCELWGKSKEKKEEKKERPSSCELRDNSKENTVGHQRDCPSVDLQKEHTEPCRETSIYIEHTSNS